MPDNSKTNASLGATKGTNPLIRQAVVDLCIARRTLMIYPASHDQVKHSLQRAYHGLSGVLDLESNITLTVMKDDLVVDNRILDSKNTAFSDLAAVFRQYQIVALIISKGLEFKEFVRFLRLTTTERDKIMAQGGIDVVAGKSRLDHVVLRTADYSKLQITEESVIQRSSRRKSGGSLWQAFVSDLLVDGDPTLPNDKSAPDDNMPPDMLAALLNRGGLRPGKAIDHYERAMAETAGNRTARSTGMSHGLQLFQRMVRELNPELQKQFLAITFDRCAQSLDKEDAGRLFEGLGADLIVRMLDQANSDGKLISPSLMAFIKKVGHLTGTGEDIRSIGSGDVDLSEGLSQSKIESLLAHEQYDVYVDSDYGRLLNDFTLQAQPDNQASSTVPWIEGMAADLTDTGIQIHAAMAMARLMTASPDAAGYRDWARQLAYLLDDLVSIRAFGYLMELMDLVRAEAAGSDAQRTEIARLLLSRFSDTQFVAKAVQAVKDSGEALTPEAVEFLAAIGEPVVLEIFDSVDPVRLLDEDGGFIQILKSLSLPATREALERISDPRPEYVIQMIRIIRHLGDNENARPVRSLLDHIDPGVRMEALATLLKFNNNWGLIRLRELLGQPTAPDFEAALDLAGEFGIRDVVPQLLSHLRHRGGMEVREAVLRTLGRIGDSRAIPDLTRMARKRWSVSRKQSERLKQVLYGTLAGYSFGQIKHLLHLGLRQNDESIQAVCRKLLREGTRDG